MAGRYDKVSGTFSKVQKRYDKVNGVWTPAKARLDKSGGVWAQSFKAYDCKGHKGAYTDEVGSTINADGSGDLRIYRNSGKDLITFQSSLEFTFDESIAYQSGDALIDFSQSSQAFDYGEQPTSFTIYVVDLNTGATIRYIGYFDFVSAKKVTANSAGTTNAIQVMLRGDLYGSDNDGKKVGWNSGELYIFGRQINSIEII